jgi:hypothetical protein
MADDNAPKRIRIENDDHYAQWVGTARDGTQFFVTNPFVPAIGQSAGREFIAVYLWNAEGDFLEARVDDLGPRSALDEARARDMLRRRVDELGSIEKAAIEVAPFQLERFGVMFGLIPQPPEDDGEDWSVTAEPGNYMAFNPPWDGEYDT